MSSKPKVAVALNHVINEQLKVEECASTVGKARNALHKADDDLTHAKDDLSKARSDLARLLRDRNETKVIVLLDNEHWEVSLTDEGKVSIEAVTVYNA